MRVARWYDEQTGLRRGYRVVDDTGRVRAHFPFGQMAAYDARAAAVRRARTLSARGIARARNRAREEAGQEQGRQWDVDPA